MTTKSWYSIKASGSKRASIDIDGEIGAWGVTSNEFKKDVKGLGDVQNIRVNLNSIGGSVGDGIAIKNTLMDHPAKVNIHIDGYALSIASVIAMGGDTKTASNDALLMIHDPWSVSFGSAEDMRKEAIVLDKHKDAIVQSYLDGGVDMDEDDLRQAMADETWYTAEEAREIGLVDKVQKSDDAKNSAIRSSGAYTYEFKNAPKHFLERFAKAEISETDDGSAVETTNTGTKMTDEKTYSEAELQEAVDQAVSEAKAESTDNEAATVLAAMLSDENATIERVQAAASMGLDAEQAKTFMAMMAKEAGSKAEEATKEPAKATNSADLLKQVMAVANRDMEDVNKNAGSDEAKPAAKVEDFDAAEELKALGVA